MALAGHKGSLSLGVTTVSLESANALARYRGELRLWRLETLSAEAATALSIRADTRWRLYWLLQRQE